MDQRVSREGFFWARSAHALRLDANCEKLPRRDRRGVLE